MTRNFSFDEVKKYLKNKSASESILDGFSTFADVAIIFTPIVFGPQFLGLIGALDVKDRLFDAGKKVLTFIENQTAPDYKDRMQQIDSAYFMLTLTAFIETLNEKLSSSDIKEVIKFMNDNEQFDFAHLDDVKNDSKINKSFNIAFPDEVEPLCDLKDNLCELYDSACKSMIEHFEKIISSISENKEKSKQAKTIKSINRITNALQSTPQRAVEIYTAQLVDLMTSFDDFAAYVQLKEFESLKKGINTIIKSSEDYDIGFKDLSNLIKSINKTQKEEEIEKIIEDLKKYYLGEINKPVAGNNNNNSDDLTGGVSVGDEHDDLTFPSVFDAYVPQAYKCLRYEKSINLENTKIWDKLPTNQNIGDFFINYLSLPQSVEYPLIVLGLPGSGKSILTKILSAQLMGSRYTVVRIPLRDIDANNDIHVIISEQISRCIQRPLKDGYAGFAEHFVDNPILIIFDGYDELLQVKGDMFNGYINKIHEFQNEQNVLGRPVRVMVTSRITLIDKVKIPSNSLVVNLEAFDQKRRNAWIDIWNNNNHNYFMKNNINPFHLKDEKELSKNVKELAEQPLLLLMLALFDSYGNALENISDDMNRTHLYDELLRRICRREGNKLYNQDVKLNKDEFVEKYVNGEMSRLGVVAIGMFNRKQLHIHTKDLYNDLITYKILNEWGEIPNDADNLIRSFFFVHKSAADNENDEKKEYAYEFLHNTFGEFLTADFILNYLVREAGELHFAHKTSMQGNIVNKKLYEADGLGYEWFVNLMFAPLYSRPLVVEMLREHLPCVLERYKFSEKDFQESLVEIVESQLKMFLEQEKLPSILSNLVGFKDIQAPLIGRIATYTLNIVIIVSLLSDNGFVFDERNYKSDTSQNSENSPWNKLTHLWKTWFSTDSLTGLARMIKTSSEEVIVEDQKLNVITLNCPNQIDDVESGLNKIEKRLNVANALSDQLEFSLFGLQTTRFTDITKKKESEILATLKSVNINLYVKYLLNKIRNEIYSNDYSSGFSRINKLLNYILECPIEDLSKDVVIELFSVADTLLTNNLIYVNTQIELLTSISKLTRYKWNDFEQCKKVRKIIVKLCYNLDDFINRKGKYYFELDSNYMIRDISFGFKRNMLYNDYDYYTFLETKNDYKNMFYDLDERNIKEYLKTNPTMVSKCLLYISTHNERYNEDTHSLIAIFLDYVFGSLDNYNMISKYKDGYFVRDFISMRALLYAIQIAKNVDYNNNINNVCEMISDLIRSKYINKKHLIRYMMTPDILVILLKNLPETFEYIAYDLKYIFKNRNFIFDDIHFVVELIQFLSNQKDCFSNTLFLHEIIERIIEDFISRDIDMKKHLSVSEYNTLSNYVEKNSNMFKRSVVNKFINNKIKN